MILPLMFAVFTLKGDDDENVQDSVNEYRRNYVGLLIPNCRQSRIPLNSDMITSRLAIAISTVIFLSLLITHSAQIGCALIC